MPDQPTNQRAAILARCSSEANMCNQILVLKQYASGRYMAEEDDVYADNIGGSSAVEDRSELKRLMQNIKEGKKHYDVVLVQDDSRLGKSTEQVQEIKDWFAQRNIPLYFQQS